MSDAGTLETVESARSSYEQVQIYPTDAASIGVDLSSAADKNKNSVIQKERQQLSVWHKVALVE
eukprot:6385409-Amphidinium_carterae.1